jgi:mono/diheme cytochrome c family protein
LLRWLARFVSVGLAACYAFAVDIAKPTFNRDMLPILQARCQVCHRPGEIAPMSFLSYESTRPWAKSIREAVLSKRMPPWFADPNFGRFANNPALSKHEIETIAAWVDSGAPEGDAKDRPPPRQWTAGWNIGTPDQTIEMPQPFTLPASGAIEYQYIILPTGFREDKWIQRVEVRPSDRASVHHAVVYIREPGSIWLKDKPGGVPFALASNLDHRPNPASVTQSDILMVYTPGYGSDGWAPGFAKKIKAGSDLVLQMHYTAHGKASVDRTRIGVLFAKTSPAKAVLTLQMGNDRFVIPAGDPNYHVQVSGTLPNDALLLSLFPHMHLRGKAFGKYETLLKVNHYDFHWQLNYRLAEPRFLPAGTHLTWAGYFDNSPNNVNNPDPAAEVRFGEQGWEEMMIGFFDVAVDAKIDKPRFFERLRN